MLDRVPCVYILASARNGTLYIGVTSDLPGRAWQHRNDQADGFTERFHVHTLAWYEVHESMESDISSRECPQGMETSMENRTHRNG